MMTLTNKYMKPDDDIRKGAILVLCQRLQAAAIKCDTYHVFVNYAAHTKGLGVYVERTDTDYKNVTRKLNRLLDEMVYLGDDDALVNLIKTVDQLQRLGIDV